MSFEMFLDWCESTPLIADVRSVYYKYQYLGIYSIKCTLLIQFLMSVLPVDEHQHVIPIDAMYALDFMKSMNYTF